MAALFQNFEQFLSSPSHVSMTEGWNCFQLSIEQPLADSDLEMQSQSESDEEYVPVESGDSDSSQSSDFEKEAQVKNQKPDLPKSKSAPKGQIKRKQSIESSEVDNKLANTSNNEPNQSSDYEKEPHVKKQKPDLPKSKSAPKGQIKRKQSIESSEVDNKLANTSNNEPDQSSDYEKEPHVKKQKPDLPKSKNAPKGQIKRKQSIESSEVDNKLENTSNNEPNQSSDYEKEPHVKKQKSDLPKSKNAPKGQIKSKQSIESSEVGNNLPSTSNNEPNQSVLSSENSVQVSKRNCNVQYFDKKPYCFYCGTQQTQIQRHWLTRHKEEHAVVEITSSVDKAQRLRRIVRLRNMGIHMHNTEVLCEQKGEFLITYRSKHATDPADYVPCEYCFCYLSKKIFYKHQCKFSEVRGQKGRKVMNASLLLPSPKGTSAKVAELLAGMLDGTTKLVARNDSLVIDYASKLVAKKGMQKKAYIRDKIREVTRFLISMRKLEGLENVTLADCILPDRFKQCISAVKELSGFQEQTLTYGTPSLALKLGHTLQKLAKITKRKNQK